MYRRLRFLYGGLATKRFHTLRTIQENTVGHHSCGVALLVAELSESTPRAELLLACLRHDLAEHKSGDSPAPAKREGGFGELLNDYESKLLEEQWGKAGLTSDEFRIFKIADCLDGIMFCISERTMGNRHLDGAYRNFRSYIEELQPTNHESYIIGVVCAPWRELVNG
jgi:5'-deoxynucleotidase YfbR-like HD superfamily hydrolase